MEFPNSIITNASSTEQENIQQKSDAEATHASCPTCSSNETFERPSPHDNAALYAYRSGLYGRSHVCHTRILGPYRRREVDSNALTDSDESDLSGSESAKRTMNKAMAARRERGFHASYNLPAYRNQRRIECTESRKRWPEYLSCYDDRGCYSILTI